MPQQRLTESEIDLPALGEALFQKRLARGNRRRPLAAALAAQEAGVCPPTITRTENAERHVSLDVYIRLCRWLEVPMEAFLKTPLQVSVHLNSEPTWPGSLMAMVTAPKDGTPVLLKTKNDGTIPERAQMPGGIYFVGRNWNDLSEWGFAAPVGFGGIPDAWLEGWLPLPDGEPPLRAWLIERQAKGQTEYIFMDSGLFQWTADRDEAMKFADRRSADQAVDECNEDIAIREHVWLPVFAEGNDHEKPRD